MRIQSGCRRLTALGTLSYVSLFWIPLFLLNIPSGSKAAEMYRVNAGATVTVNEHGVCRKVKNNGTEDRMVPTKTAAEWNAVISNPHGLVLSACEDCVGGGVKYAGYCWYKSVGEESCTTLCSDKGGVNTAGTVNYVGSGGTLANCKAVSAALGHIISGNGTDNSNCDWIVLSMASFMAGHNARAIGCVAVDVSGTKNALRCLGATTDPNIGAGSPIYQRICACNGS